MKLKKARTCEGCKALDSSGHAIIPCQLRFNNYGGYNAHLGITIRAPQEPCYKPLTIAQLFEAIDLIGGH